MTGMSLDAAQHTKFQYREYLVGHKDKTDKSMAFREDDSIYLQPSCNLQGRFYVFNLLTNQQVHQFNGTSQPITQAVINRVGELARPPKSPMGIIFDDDDKK